MNRRPSEQVDIPAIAPDQLESARHFRLGGYRLQVQDESHILVLFTGYRGYQEILTRAFPQLEFGRTLDVLDNIFKWGILCSGAAGETKEEAKRLLELCKHHLYLDDGLTECFALDFHTVLPPARGYRTELGELVYHAKYGRCTLAERNRLASIVSRQMLCFIQAHPSYRRSDVIIAAPPSRPDKVFDLPSALVQFILAAYDTMVDGSGWITKVRRTRPMKNLLNRSDKIDNVRNAFLVTNSAGFYGKTVLLVDDIYESGATLNEVSKVLVDAGAREVLGLVATKTGRDM